VLDLHDVPGAAREPAGQGTPPAGSPPAAGDLMNGVPCPRTRYSDIVGDLVVDRDETSLKLDAAFPAHAGVSQLRRPRTPSFDAVRQRSLALLPMMYLR